MSGARNICSVHGEFAGDGEAHLKTGHGLGDYVEVLDRTKTNRFVVLRGDMSQYSEEPYFYWTTRDKIDAIVAKQKREVASHATKREQSQ